MQYIISRNICRAAFFNKNITAPKKLLTMTNFYGIFKVRLYTEIEIRL